MNFKIILKGLYLDCYYICKVFKRMEYKILLVSKDLQFSETRYCEGKVKVRTKKFKQWVNITARNSTLVLSCIIDSSAILFR